MINVSYPPTPAPESITTTDNGGVKVLWTMSAGHLQMDVDGRRYAAFVNREDVPQFLEALAEMVSAHGES
jgi:hypothetical protein